MSTTDFENQNFSVRLTDERKRICPHQKDFARLVGVTPAKQSQYESGALQLREDYLARISDAGIDVLYVLTGQRGGALLPKSESHLLNLFRQVDVVAQEALLLLLERMGNNTHADAAAMSLHSPGDRFKAEE